MLQTAKSLVNLCPLRVSHVVHNTTSAQRGQNRAACGACVCGAISCGMVLSENQSASTQDITADQQDTLNLAREELEDISAPSVFETSRGKLQGLF